MPPNEVAEVILGLVQQVSETVEDRSGQSPFEKASGSTVWNFRRQSGPMKQFDDPGPALVTGLAIRPWCTEL